LVVQPFWEEKTPFPLLFGCGEAALGKARKARAKNGFRIAGISSSLFPGAQDTNAERVPFEGRAEQNLLLHFWPLAVLLFAPQQLKVEKKNGELKVTTDFVGYTLAVPDVANLTKFVREYPRLLANLSKDARGYRPAQAVIDLPAEGALAFLDELATLAGLQVETDELRFSIGGVEYLHLHKPPKQNNVKLMTAGRIAPNRRLLSGYRAILCPKDESTRYRNPLFRRGLLAALFDEVPWYRPFARTFSVFDEGVFIRQSRKADDENGLRQFATDAAKKFRHETKLFTQTLERHADMSEIERLPAPLPVLVEQVIRNYLLGKAKAKCNVDVRTKMSSLTEVQKKDVYEKKRLVAKETFLAARSRRDADFVSYFSTVICSAGTYFDRKSPDFQVFATALIDPTQTDTIKTLTLLALSANS
jgi:CRISPR-associated protein Cmx8